MKKQDRGYIRISKTKSKKQPFKVTIISRNGEPLAGSETFTTFVNAEKNIMADMKVFGAKSVLIEDARNQPKRIKSYKYNIFYCLFANGRKKFY